MLSAALCVTMAPNVVMAEEDTGLQGLQGSYVELFPEFAREEYKDYWMECINAYETDEEMADMYYLMLTQGYMGTLTGQEAIDEYASEEASFDCFFENGLSRLTIDGDVISGADADGNEIFSYSYTYEGDVDGVYADMIFEDYFHAYKADADDAGIFTYFIFTDDIPEETYHIEYRYGENLDELGTFIDGEYAYWMPSGINADYGDSLIKDCIKLFVDENLGGEDVEPVLDGTGSEEDPFLIENTDDLLAFAASVNDGSMYGYADMNVMLTQDIDLEGIAWTPIGNMDDMETYSTMFMGTFDGGGHTISNLTYESDEFNCGAGMFGVSLGTIKDLTVENAVVSVTEASSMAIGCVVGYNMYGTVENVHLTGTSHVAGNNCTGGIAGGSLGGMISDCSVEGLTVTVIGDNDFSSGRLIQVDVAEVGGLIVGGGFGGKIDNCTASGTVEAAGNEPVGMGGIGGCLVMMDSITNCTADVTIISEKGGHAIGGLCGYAGTHSVSDVAAEEGIFVENYPAVIENCHVTVAMDIPGATHVGGLIGTGLYYFGEETAFDVTNCSASGTIDGAVTPGALFGRAEGCSFDSCEAQITADGEELAEMTGTTDRMYESADQFEE